MIMYGLIEDHRSSRDHLCHILLQGVWSIQRDASVVRDVFGLENNKFVRSHVVSVHAMEELKHKHDAICSEVLNWLTRCRCVL